MWVALGVQPVVVVVVRERELINYNGLSNRQAIYEIGGLTWQRIDAISMRRVTDVRYGYRGHPILKLNIQSLTNLPWCPGHNWELCIRVDFLCTSLHDLIGPLIRPWEMTSLPHLNWWSYISYHKVESSQVAECRRKWKLLPPFPLVFPDSYVQLRPWSPCHLAYRHHIFSHTILMGPALWAPINKRRAHV